ncbi:MAG: leucyl/phenylalanyl-tRNA--protein transferase [Anaerolineaceae bacterium]|nr:leucyl/phenylalanyl-tRNA--protein transferase [Anaerolineaceae bacterium]MCB9101079.1 leucyl/phenylalanyl-tRNA--protein transferase [Anaerolineales bacterium]
MHLTPHLLLNAYYQGVFPMAHDDGHIYWYDPNPRAIIPLDEFHVPRRLARVIRRGGFEVRFDYDFRAVISACAEPAEGREKTWINDDIINSYCQLYELGFAHSVETWIDDQLVGGLYGVSLQGVFAGESMFSRAPDTSKVALVYLIEHLRSRGFVLLDTQFITPHLARFGAIEIPRAEYKARLAKALRVQTWF